MKTRNNKTRADDDFDPAATTGDQHDSDTSQSYQLEPVADDDEPSELDEPDPSDADDDRWDVFLFDDDDPLPEYGDFWLPD